MKKRIRTYSKGKPCRILVASTRPRVIALLVQLHSK